MTNINKQTYYKLSRFIIGLISSNKRNGKYKCTKTELKNKYYFKIEIVELDLFIYVPFKALFKTNEKIKGIHGLNFSPAKNCISKNKGLCQLKDYSLCYAIIGENRNSSDLINGGYLKVNSFYHGLLSEMLINLLKRNDSLFKHFLYWLNNVSKITHIRFNVNGDFKTVGDLKFLIDLTNNFNGVVYGYTARDDLNINETNYSNVFINGSNEMYTNKYSCTYSLETYYNSILHGLNCLGGCLGCKKCFKLRNKELVNLFHNKDSDYILNTFNNRLFIVKLVTYCNIELTETDLKTNKGIFKSLETTLKNKHGINLKENNITNIKDFLIYYVKNGGLYDLII